MTQKNIFVDLKYCFGCRACEVACKQEHSLPVGIKWLNVVKVGPRPVDGKLQMDFVPMRCRHCARPACLEACPEKAITKRTDGIVLIDPERCTGCLACVEACPFGAVQLNEQTGVAEKCTLCVHRVDAGLEPACVHTCPAKCLYFGDGKDLIKVKQKRAAESAAENTRQSIF